MFGNRIAETFDIDAFKDDCYNIFGEGSCGNSSNVLLNRSQPQMVVRGIRGLWYYPQSEVAFRSEYRVTVEVWSYNIWWQNLIIIAAFLSSIFFARSYKNNLEAHILEVADCNQQLEMIKI